MSKSIVFNHSAPSARVSNAPAPPAPPAAPPNMMPDQAINDYIRVPDKMVGLSEYIDFVAFFLSLNRI